MTAMAAVVQRRQSSRLVARHFTKLVKSREETMIEPIRGQLGAYDLSCAACGIVERFEDLRLAPHLFLPKLAAKGWRRLAGRHYCRECQSPARPAAGAAGPGAGAGIAGAAPGAAASAMAARTSSAAVDDSAPGTSVPTPCAAANA